VPQAAGSAPLAGNTPQGFGAETVRAPQQRQAPAAQVSEISATVTAITQRGPGLYAFTLDDGAQWQFAESAASSYRAPRVGSTVEIERGALGSFLMRFDKQSPVAVRRTR
jgi:hypothetical protein